MHGQRISAAVAGSIRWLVEASSRASAGDAPTTRARQEPPFGPNLLHQILLLQKIQRIPRAVVVFGSRSSFLEYVLGSILSVLSNCRGSKQGNNRGGWESAIKKTPTQVGKLTIRCRPSSSHKTVSRCLTTFVFPSFHTVAHQSV
jgi:hypothetical protein